jgi:hypothetical protein
LPRQQATASLLANRQQLATGEVMAIPNYRQEKKRREDQQRKKKEQKQQEKAARKGVSEPQPR